MSAILDYLFKPSHYQEVTSTFHELSVQQEAAFNQWKSEQHVTINGEYKSKVYVYEHRAEIHDLDSWMRTTQRLMNTSKKAVEWFFYDKGMDSIPALRSDVYRLIALNVYVINKYNLQLGEYYKLMNSSREAVDRFLGAYYANHTFDQIKAILDSRVRIIAIQKTLDEAERLKRSYPKTWLLFAKGRELDEIPIEELQKLSKDVFKKKELSVSIYPSYKKLWLLNYGEEDYDLADFLEVNVNWEYSICTYLSADYEPIKTLDEDIRLEGKELRRAILDSTFYGKDVNFADSFGIDDFYHLRKSTDLLGLEFDAVIDRAVKYREAIRSYRLQKYGEANIFIQDYLPASTKGSELYNYIELYKEEQQKKDLEEQQQRRKREEEERKRKEEERQRLEEKRKREEEALKREKISQMKGCVLNWHVTRYGFFHDYLYEYLKTTALREACKTEWDIRHLIWAFKNDPQKMDRQYSYQKALDTIIPRYEEKLRSTFGNLLPQMTLACIPASGEEKNRRRWEAFANRVCHDLSMWNAYDYIRIIRDAVPKHLGGDGQAVLSYDESFFKGKFIILCDDIKTTGASLQRMRCNLEAVGATVICALTIGITIHE